MPTGKLEFALPEEQQEFMEACAAGKLHAVISGYLEELRRRLKYDDMTEERRQAVETLRDELWDLIRDLGVEDLFRY